MTFIHDPGGLGYRMEAVYAYLAEHGEDDEAIMGVGTANGVMPLVFGDEDRALRFRKVARDVGKKTGKRVRLVRFEHRVDMGDA